MLRKLLSCFTVLALCLSLLPGTALAEGTEPGVVVITGTGESAAPFTLVDGGIYVAKSGEDGGGVEQVDEAPESGVYLTYSSGTLTVQGVQGGTFRLYGRMVLTGNLTIPSIDGASQWLSIEAPGGGPTLILSGHQLILGSGVMLNVSKVSEDDEAIKGNDGTIIMSNNSRLSVTNGGGLAANDLTVKGGNSVSFMGKPSDGSGVVENVTFQSCSSVTVRASDSSADIKDLAKGFESDNEVTLKIESKGAPYPSEMKWIPEDDLSGLCDVTAPTCYRVGQGWAFYVPAESEGPPTLTLENVTYDNSISHNGALRVALVGENVIEGDIDITTGDLTLTGAGRLTAGLKTDGSSAVENGTTLIIPADQTLAVGNLTNSGTIVNEGTITLSGGGIDAQTIQRLNLQGENGKVVIKDASGSNTTYNNSGVRQLEPAGELDLSIADDTDDKLSSQGYKWEPVKNDPGDSDKITGGTLTLDKGFSATKVTLPAGDVRIVTQGDSSIREFGFTEASEGATRLTFSGSGKLTVQTHIELSGGNKNSLTVDTGAKVEVNGGVTVGTSGGVDGTVTVNGTLTAKQGTAVAAVRAGQVVVSNGGMLNVEGETGVQAGGMGGDNGTDYTGAFTVQPGGTFTASCSESGNAIEVNEKDGHSLPENLTAESIIDIPNGYLPQGCEREFGDGRRFVFIAGGNFTISSANVPTPPPVRPTYYSVTVTASEGGTASASRSSATAGSTVTLTAEPAGGYVFKEWVVVSGGVTIENDSFRMPGRNVEIQAVFEHAHAWSQDWTHDETYHWHECTADGCGVTDPSQMDGYGTHSYDDEQDTTCNSCGYVREVEHQHIWAGEWSCDETHHWHVCTAEGCGVTEISQMDGYEEHLFASELAAGCSVCGYQRTVTPPEPPTPPVRPEPPAVPSGGGGGGGSASYPITVEKPEHGAVTSDRSSASGGRVTLTVTPDEGYALDSLTVADSRGNEVKLTDQGGGKYTFNMPGRSVTVRAVFAPLPDSGCPSRRFPDLDTGAWYHEAVDFVLENGLMNGYDSGLFGPNDYLSRAMLCQILYNREGRPAVTGGTVFSDVAEGQWYAAAVMWAAEKGIVTGHGDGRFGPEDWITREQLTVMLWRYAGSPAAADRELRFTDADKAGGYALEALRWAVEKGVLNGTGGGLLDPQGLATRAQAAQMLKNML